MLLLDMFVLPVYLSRLSSLARPRKVERLRQEVQKAREGAVCSIQKNCIF